MQNTGYVVLFIFLDSFISEPRCWRQFLIAIPISNNKCVT